MESQIKKDGVIDPAGTSAPARPVKFVHQRGMNYQVFHGDGAWGVISNQGNIVLDVFIEYPPKPSYVVQPVAPDGTFAGEQTMHGMVDDEHFLVIREFQAGFVMSFAAAVQVRALLDNFINATQAQMNAAIAQIQKQA